MNEPSEANINHRDYHLKSQKWETHNDLQTMVFSGQNDKNAMHLIFLHHSPFTLPSSFGDLVEGWIQAVDVVADVTLVTQQ